MNNERFIEQLNAYIDRELSGDEMRELEAELAASPKRQQIYRSYCKIDKACQTLSASGRVNAPKPSVSAIVAAAEAQRDGSVVEFPFAPATRTATSTSGLSWGTAFAGLAAACVAAFVYVAGPQTSNVPNPALTPAPAVAEIGPDDSVDGREPSAYRTVFAVDAGTSDRSDSFAWMTQLQFAPIERIQVDTLEFKTAEPLEVRTLSAYAYPYPGLDDTPPLSETAAFQFQR
jgi:anti-sigma factor RsiW